MNLGLYENGFIPGETVTIDMPCASFDRMETTVVHPRPMDILAPDEVLVKNPVAPTWVLKLPKGFLLKAGGERSFAARSFPAPVSLGTVIR